MSESTTITLNEALVGQLDEYCLEHHVSRETAVESALCLLLGNESRAVSDLIAGYVEMGAVNAEICSAFAGCESEAAAHIH